TQSVILIIAALAIAILIIWLLRSRTDNAGEHIDTSVTAVGATAEAVRDVAEDVAQTIKDSLKADVAASGAKADDVPAKLHNAAAIMASGGAAAGAVTLTNIGVPAAAGAPDNLRQLKGVGPKLAGVLTQLGITRFD